MFTSWDGGQSFDPKPELRRLQICECSSLPRYPLALARAAKLRDFSKIQKSEVFHASWDPSAGNPEFENPDLEPLAPHLKIANGRTLKLLGLIQ